MKPAKFTYACPRSVEEALALLAEGGEGAKLLAGGQSLVPLLNLRMAQVDWLIALNRLPTCRSSSVKTARSASAP